MNISLPEAITRALVDSGLCDPAQADPSAPIAAVAAPTVATVATPADTGNFIQPAWFGRLDFAMRLWDGCRGACLFGPRGSGKTRSVHELARMHGAELITFQAAAGNGIDDLIGQRDLIDGKTVFTPGPLPEALERDAWLLCEEANVMHPGTWSKMNTLLDGSGDSLRLPDGRRLTPGPKFRVVLAFNEGAQYAGTREVNAALRDRLMPIYCDYLEPAHEARIIAGQTGVDSSSADRLTFLAGNVRQARSSLGFDLSPRALVRMTMLVRCCGETWRAAFEHAVLDLIGDPLDKAPQREAVLQIAMMADIDSWPMPEFEHGGNGGDS